MDLLIHSMNELGSIIFPVLNAVKPRSIVEVGAEHGGMTTRLHDWSTEHGATLTSIDPSPSEAFRTWSEGVQGFTHIEAPSLDAIPGLDDTDCWFIDGDHNWYTVFHELQLIHAHARRAASRCSCFCTIPAGRPAGVTSTTRRSAYLASIATPTAST